MQPLELKARLLCEGANPDGPETVDALASQNPQRVLRGGLSSGLKIKLAAPAPSSPCPGRKEFLVNFPLYSKIQAPLKVRTTENGIIILENDQEVGRAEILKPPAWYGKTIDGYPITSILTSHNDQLAGSVYEWCCLFNTGQQCRFCLMNRSQKRPELRDVSRKADLLLKALQAIPRETFKGLCLNGGMTLAPGRGLEIIIPVIQQIRAQMGRELPISVETTPPTDTRFIEDFAEAGGDSLMMNLEMWDDDIRQETIPGKAEYCPKDDYLKAFEKAVQVLGKGKVSTCFIVGTEPLESLKEGVRTAVSYDVMPSPLAGRYFEQFANYPFQPRADWREFLEIFRFARAEMAKRNLASQDQAGCFACGMCDIIGDPAV